MSDPPAAGAGAGGDSTILAAKFVRRAEAIARHQGLRWLLIGLSAAVVLLSEARRLVQMPADQAAGQAGFSLLIVLIWLLALLQETSALAVAAAAAAMVLAAVIGGLVPLAALVAAVALAGARFPPRVGIPFLILAIGGFAATAWVSHRPRAAALDLWVLTIVYALFYAMRLLHETHAKKERAQAELATLEARRRSQLEAARASERLRVAREMHDVLGHTFSALAVQLEGARALLERRADTPAALEAVVRAHRLASEGIQEARRAIGALRSEDLPGPDLLPELVEEFRRTCGAEARLEVGAEPVPLAPEIRLALYRSAQEALTNVRKHAQARRVRVRLDYRPQGVELVVENDGRRGRGPEPGGQGLLGMRERAELLGGRLEAGPTDAGFRVRVWLPASPAGSLAPAPPAAPVA